MTNLHDTNKYLIYNDYETAVDMNLKIWQNLFFQKAIFDRDGKVYNTYTELEEDYTSVTNPLPYEYVIIGKRQNIDNKNEGFTLFWAAVKEKYNQAGVYFIPKPIDILMTGITYDAIEEYNDAWLETLDL